MVPKKLGLGNEKKEQDHLEIAPEARCSLAIYEYRQGNEDRAIKHLVIAVEQGSTEAKKDVWKRNQKKEGFTACLRAYQIAVEVTKSPQPQREAAA